MSKYDYTRAVIKYERLQSTLAQYDFSGWRLVSHCFMPDNDDLVHCIFRKRIPRKKEVDNG